MEMDLGAGKKETDCSNPFNKLGQQFIYLKILIKEI